MPIANLEIRIDRADSKEHKKLIYNLWDFPLNDLFPILKFMDRFHPITREGNLVVVSLELAEEEKARKNLNLLEILCESLYCCALVIIWLSLIKLMNSSSSLNQHHNDTSIAALVEAHRNKDNKKRQNIVFFLSSLIQTIINYIMSGVETKINGRIMIITIDSDIC